MEEKIILVCEQCGSQDIEMHAWVKVNTLKYVDDANSGDIKECRWCNNCGEHVDFISQDEFDYSNVDEFSD